MKILDCGMLLGYDSCADSLPFVSISKQVDGKNASRNGAFCISDKVTLEIATSFDVEWVDVIITNEESKELLLPLVESSASDDKRIFRLRLDLQRLVASGESTLLRWCLRLATDKSQFYTSSVNNVDFTLDKERAIDFRMLCYEEGYATPSRFYSGVMYQIFPDRFATGGREIPVRENAVVNNDWYDGVPQYAEKPGGFVANNMFFGGNIYGIADKLDYLKSLGVTCIYLNPIFEAYSNHKYDTGDYLKVDSMLGGNEAFEMLLEKAHAVGVSVILDGVFNHTGDDSLYFDRYGRYGSNGAYTDKDSIYHDWYCFKEHPDSYDSWWGIEILPKLNQANPSCREFFTGKNGVCQKYIAMGADGWRLDVADELPDVFLNELRQTVKGERQDALIIGEVWENASDKVAYGQQRRYFGGKQLDSVMNYPFKEAVIEFVRNADERGLYNTLTDLYSSYPRCASDCLMNILGTHDTQRVLTALSDDDISSLDNNALARHKMPDTDRELAVKRLKLASVIQYTVYGFPSVYYGDEAGMEGGHDPFCRRPFPWGREDIELVEHYRRLGGIRKECESLNGGDFAVDELQSGFIAYKRKARDKDEELLIVANASDKEVRYAIECEYTDLLTDKKYSKELAVPSLCGMILRNISE